MKGFILKNFLLCILLNVISIGGYAQSNDVLVPKAGKLSSLIKVKKDVVTSLVVRGELNSSDIFFIRSLPNLEKLDLSGATIVVGGKKFKVQVPEPRGWNNLDFNQDNTSHETLSEIYRADVLPTGCFAGLKKLSSLVLPATLEEMTYNVFYGSSNLQEITIQGVVRVYNNTFSGCLGLKKIILGEKGKVNSGNYIHEKVELEQIDFIGDVSADLSNWDNVENMFKTIFRPHYLFFKDTGHLALYDPFGSNYIKEDVSIIWRGAFHKDYTNGSSRGDEKLTHIEMPNSVLVVGFRAFERCSNLSSVKFSSNLQIIDEGAFSGCNLSEIELPSIVYIGRFAFGYNKQLTKCTLGNKLETIHDQAFRDCCNLRTIVLPETVTYIGEGAFSDCKNLSTVNALMKKPANIYVDSNSSFEEKYVTTIFVPHDAYDGYMASDWNKYPLGKEGGKEEFDVTVETPGALLNLIGIDNVLSVRKLILKGTLNDKDMEVIKQMVNLRYVNLENTQIIMSQEKKNEEKAYNDFVKGIAGLADESAKNAYQRKEMSTEKYQRTQIGNAMIRASVDNSNKPDADGSVIYSNIFAGFKFLESVFLPKNTTIIAHHAFANCLALKEVKMSDNLVHAGDKSFENCISLKEINFTSLQKLGVQTFAGCSQLSNVNLPEGLLSIGENAFLSCGQLLNVCIPGSVKEIANLFGANTGIKEIHCKGSLPPTLKYKTDSNKKYKIFVPVGSSGLYYNAWGKLNIVEE